MSITNATRLSDFAAGIGTEGAILKIDNANQRIGIGTQLPNQMLTVAGIVSATQYIGDGSQLEGITSAGLGTAIDETEGSAGAVIYFTDDLLTVSETTTVNPPASASAAYTQYRDVKLNDSVDLIIETGDDFIPDILGFGEDTTDPNAAGNGVFDEVYAGVIKNKNGLGAPAFANGLTSVGVITATGGFAGDVTGNVNNSSNLLLKVDGGEKGRINSSGNFGVGHASPTARLDVRRADADGLIAEFHQNAGYGIDIGSSQADAYISSGNAQNFIFKTNAGGGQLERLRIGMSGQLGIGGANYGTTGQVLTSQGNVAAPQWADASGGAWNLLSTTTITSSTEIEIAIPQDGAYDEYVIKFVNVAVQNGTGFRFRMKAKLDGSYPSGTPYQQGAYGRVIVNNGNATGSGSAGKNIVDEILDSQVWGLCATMIIQQPMSNYFDKGIYIPQIFALSEPGSSASAAYVGTGAVSINDTKANNLTSIVVFNTGGGGSGTVTWDTGKVKLYGIS